MKVRSSRRRQSTVLETLEHRTLLSVTSITVNAINPTEGTPFGSAINPAQIGNFDVNNYIGLDESSQYSAVINWGDGSQSAGLGPVTIQFVANLGNGNAEYGVYSYHTYALATTSSNPDELTINVADNTGPGTLQSQSGPVQVNSAPLENSYTPATINATIGVPLTNVTIGQFIDTNNLAVAGNYAVSVNWGDGQFSSGTVVPYKTSTQLGGTGVEFTIEASHTYTSGGSFTVAALISEIGGAQLTETTPITVTGSSLQQITAAPISAVVGVPFTGTVASFTDPNPSDTASEFSATINWGNGDSTAGTVESVGSGAFIVTAVDPVSHNGFTYTSVGTYNVTISVTGPNSTKFTAFTTATVADAPITATGLTLGLAPNLIYTFPPFSGVVATFTDGNPSATLSNFTATINWGDGTVSPGTISFDPTMLGVFDVSGTHQYPPSSTPYQAIITINSKGGATATAFTTITITDTPITPGTGTPISIAATKGVPFTLEVGTFTDGNPGALPSQYATTINWGDGTSTSSGIIGKQANGTFTVTGTHTYANVSGGTPYAITVTIADIAGTSPGTATDTATATVSDAPLSSQGSPIIGVAGVGLSPTPITVATFTDSDPNGIPADYTATINWGDGTATTAGTISQTGTSPNGSTFSVSGSHTYAMAGNYQTSVTIVETGGSQTVAVGGAVIADAPITATGLTLGVAPNLIYTYPPFSGEVATFTDPNANLTASDFTAAINWGDGTQTPGTVAVSMVTPGVFVVSGTHLFGQSSSPYQATITIRDIGGATATAGTSITVSDTAITAGTVTAITATTSMPFTAQVGTFTDANPAAVPSQYATTINWGDGISTSGVVSKEADGTFIVTGSHTYANVSGATPFALTVTITDIAGTSPGTATDTGTATVSDAPLTSLGSPITGVAGVGLTPSPITVATFTDSDPNGIASDYSAVINWGDGTATTVGTITQTGTSPNGSTFSVSGAHTYDNPGDFQTTVTITEVGGSKTVAVGNAVIADAPLSATPIQPTVSTTEATVFTGPVASFTSANPTETVGDFNYVTIDWGDGTPLSFGTVTQPGGVGTEFLVSGTHTYATAGVSSGIGQYPITVAVHAVGGSTLNIANTANVADVPLFVTGKLNPASDSGVSNSDDITNVVQPNFLGTTNQPNATVNIYATVSGGAPVLIGQGVSNANDAWSITSDQVLATGTYLITAIAIDQYGHTVSSDTTIVPELVIDTVPPVITAASFNRFDDTLTVTYQDNLSGLDYASIANGSFYHLSAKPLSPKVPVPKLLLPTAITVTPAASPTSPVTVTVVFNHGHTVRGGSYLIVINSGTGDNGVQDIAGNALDGNFYGSFPTGDGLAGGNLAAAISTFHNHITLAPVPVQDGYVAPGAVTIDPPASVAKTTKLVRLIESRASVKLVIQTAKQANVHDLAMGALIFDKKDKRDRR